jgi:hypothetical protein
LLTKPGFTNRENPYMFRDAMLKLVVVAETLPYAKLIED